MKQTEYTSITRATKLKVAQRDSVDGWPCCIGCGAPAPHDGALSFSCAHYVPRSRGGAGREENIGTLCWECHTTLDRKLKGWREIDAKFRKRLEDSYPGWDPKMMKYRKGCMDE